MELTNKQEDDLLEAGREYQWAIDEVCECCGMKKPLEENTLCEDCI